jgi:membrane peptidoglycan carboxypeptidase
MSAKKPTARGALGAFAGFIGMSVVAGLLVTAAVTPAIAVTGMAANDSIGIFEGLPEYLKIDQLSQNSTIYAKQGGNDVPIATFYDQNRVEVDWKNIGQNVKDAAVSTEDPRFYDHGGIDLMGTVRGALMTALHQDVQGGSSITQQYVKNVRVQKCERLNIVVEASTEEEQKKKQAAQNKKYRACYADATETTPDRKLQEMKMAIGLEKKYSKNQILQGYLNIAGFGGQVYGIESAARYYFGATANTLTLPQAATLVAILNNPNYLRIDGNSTPPSDKSLKNTAENGYAAAKERRDYVLDRMLVNHKITQKEHDEAVATKIEPKITPQPNGCDTAAQYNAAFYCDWVRRLIQKDKGLGKTADDRAALLRQGGLKIYTPLNLDLQAAAQQAMNEHVPATHPGVDLGAANVSVEVGTGRVVTMVQNRAFNNTDQAVDGTTAINYNTDYDEGGSFGFQTGSSYKAFTLLEWLKEGHSVNDRISASSAPISLSASRFHSSCAAASPANWPEIGNDGPGEGGNMSVVSATSNSVNTAYAIMATKLDLCGILNTAKSFGIHLAYPYQLGSDEKRELGGNPSSILGTNEIAPVTMAAAYAGIANSGKFCTPVGIDRITDSTGKELPVTKTSCTQAVDPNIAAGAAYALQRVMSGGTGSAANPGGTPILGKTGTTDNAAQNWLVTSTTKVATATWVGNVQKLPGAADFTDFGDLRINGVYGRNVKLYLAKPIIAALNGVYGGDDFPSPSGSVLQAKQITVPDLTGKSPDEAKNTLENLGFTYADGGPIDSAQPAGTVASTDPAAGSSAGIGSTITVYTSNGNLVMVPANLVGMKVSDAIKALQQAGFGYSYKGDQNATVTATDPAPGSAAPKGTKVTLTAKAAADDTKPDGAAGGAGG